MSDSLPVKSVDDVLAAMPVDIKRPAVAPLRDAIAAAMAEVYRAYQDSAAFSAGQVDPLRATDIYLEGIGQDHGIVKVPGETDAAYSARLFKAPELVSPQAIYDAVYAIVSRHSTGAINIVEPEADGGYVTNGTGNYDSVFVGAVTPHYPDRLYPDDSAENNGYVNTYGDPGGWLTYNYLGGRSLHVRIPSLAAVDTDISCVSDQDSDASYVSDSDPDEMFIFADSASADDLYGAIAAVVDTTKAAGFRSIITVG